MEASVQFIKTNNLLLTSPQTETLKDGQSVFIRVISKNQNGFYTVSLNGSRINVQSNKTLEVGKSFSAVINIGENGRINLVPEESFNQNAQIINLYTSLLTQGFTPDENTVRVLQFLEQTGLKIEKSIIEKAKKAALLFPGKEKIASEIASLLLEKGVEPTKEAIENLIELFENYSENGQGDSKNEHQKSRANNKDSSENFLNKLYDSSVSEKPGLLTFINQIAPKNKHWIFLPYEWSFKKIKFKGIIRFLLNLDTKITEKVEINCKSDLKSYDFVLYFLENKVKEIRFCTLPPLLTSEILFEEKRLGDFLSSGMNERKSVPVTYSPCAFIDGLCVLNEEPVVFEKSV